MAQVKMNPREQEKQNTIEYLFTISYQGLKKLTNDQMDGLIGKISFHQISNQYEVQVRQAIQHIKKARRQPSSKEQQQHWLNYMQIVFIYFIILVAGCYFLAIIWKPQYKSDETQRQRSSITIGFGSALIIIMLIISFVFFQYVFPYRELQEEK